MKTGGFRSEQGHSAYVRAYDAAMTRMPEPSATHDVPTAFGTVRAYAWGEAGGIPVLLLPGRSSGVPMWGENLPDLLPHRRVIAMDALGDAGMSVQTAPLRSLDDQAAWVDQALEGLGIERAHSVGHSFGGATAAAHAIRFPARLASLALLEPAFTLAWPPASTFFWTTVASLPVPQSWRDRALAAIGGVSVADIRARTPLSEMIATGSAEYRAALPMPVPLSDESLAGLRMPVYAAIASRSSLAGGRRAAARAGRIPGGTVEVWPDTTHSLPMQVHEALGRRLVEFWSAAERA